MYSPKHIFWDESLSTGDSFLDTQHKYLIEICNDLASAIEKQHGQKIVDMVLHVLMFYAESHFKKEEECMERYRCAVAQQNQKAHSVFLEKLRAWTSEHQATIDPDQLANDIHQYLTAWIVDHIMHVDSRLHEAIHKKP